MTRTLTVSRPTFSELREKLGGAGLADLFNEDGDIDAGVFVIHTESNVPQTARFTQAIDDAAERTKHCNPDSVYEDADVEISTKCRGSDVQVIERRRGVEARVVEVPRAGLHLLAGDLIECMGKPDES